MSKIVDYQNTSITDWTEYNDFVSSGTLVSSSSVYSTVLSITGEGYIRQAIVTAYANTLSPLSGIKITIDGVLTLYVSGTGGNNYSRGFITQESIFPASSNMAIGGSVNQIIRTAPDVLVTLPYTSGSDKIVINYRPIKFKKSLLIEAMYNQNTATTPCGAIYSIVGGVKA
jgi:hypothetical protein